MEWIAGLRAREVHAQPPAQCYQEHGRLYSTINPQEAP